MKKKQEYSTCVSNTDPNFIKRVITSTSKQNGITMVTLNVLNYLLDYLDFNEYRPFPCKRKDLAKIIGVSEKSIRDSLIVLENCGILIRNIDMGSKKYTSNYSFIINFKYNLDYDSYVENFIRTQYGPIIENVKNPDYTIIFDGLIDTIRTNIIIDCISKLKDIEIPCNKIKKAVYKIL